MRVAALLTALFLVAPAAPPRPTLDAQDRAAFLAWFTLLADAQFYRADPRRHRLRRRSCGTRHAKPSAITRPSGSAASPSRADTSAPRCARRPIAAGDSLPLFRVSDTTPARYAEFADARTILRLNASLVSRDAAAARPGDLLAFRQEGQRLPEHLMVFVGRSAFEPARSDWAVYHTGPDAATGAPGEMRKASLADLRQHPSPRWRPVAGNPAFLGVYRLRIP